MKNETFKEAFSSVTASDDMVNKAMQIPAENEIRPSFSGWQIARRVAAAAVIVAVLIGVMVGLPTKDGELVPFFSIHVYANETDSVELSVDGVSSAVSNIIKDSNHQFNSFFGEPDSLFSGPSFSIDVTLDDSTRAYTEITVMCNGEPVKTNFSKKIYIVESFNVENGELTGIRILGTADKYTQIDVILTDANNNVLQHSTMGISVLAENGYDVRLIESHIADTH